MPGRPLRVGIVDTLSNPLVDEYMLRCDLIVTGQSDDRRYGDANVIGVENGNTVIRRGGVAVVMALSSEYAENRMSDAKAVPDPVVIVVIKGQASKRLTKAAKARKATVIELLPGYAACAEGHNTLTEHRVDLAVLSEPRRASKKSRSSATPKPKPEPKSEPVSTIPVSDPAPAPAKDTAAPDDEPE